MLPTKADENSWFRYSRIVKTVADPSVIAEEQKSPASVISLAPYKSADALFVACWANIWQSLNSELIVFRQNAVG